ncbi:MAG: hypothetical protein D6722_11500 [Bacteroidetes bacterium]|nr:MAG: hypothetical protein D6722_11500 [Bacteroidota bacterium]
MTSTSSATSATTPRSWVIKMSPIPVSCCRSLSNVRMRCCTVTSRAVVGSSAMSKAGSQETARAIITRCFCPPES